MVNDETYLARTSLIKTVFFLFLGLFALQVVLKILSIATFGLGWLFTIINIICSMGFVYYYLTSIGSSKIFINNKGIRIEKNIIGLSKENYNLDWDTMHYAEINRSFGLVKNLEIYNKKGNISLPMIDNPKKVQKIINDKVADLDA